jgi:hypothetical protein
MQMQISIPKNCALDPVIPREHPAICSFLIGEPSLTGRPETLSEVCIKQSPVG